MRQLKRFVWCLIVGCTFISTSITTYAQTISLKFTKDITLDIDEEQCNKMYNKENGVDTQEVYNYVNQFNNLYNTYIQSKFNFMTHYGYRINTIPNNQQGWWIDTTTLKEDITNALLSESDTTINLKVNKVGKTGIDTDAKRNPALGNTYIEVDKTLQHIWVWKGDKVIFDTDVVTGLPNSYRETPSGYWHIFNRGKDVTLIGPTWKTPVTYWMKFTQSGCGFHDATWQKAFGGNRYLKYGSHGCINMRKEDAQWLYNNTSINTPVIIYDINKDK